MKKARGCLLGGPGSCFRLDLMPLGVGESMDVFLRRRSKWFEYRIVVRETVGYMLNLAYCVVL